MTSIPEYLSKLDYDQLVNTVEKAKALIEEKDKEKRVHLILLEGVYGNEACFYAEEFDTAKKALAEYITKSADFTVDDIGFHDHPKLVNLYVRESEVDHYMELKD